MTTIKTRIVKLEKELASKNVFEIYLVGWTNSDMSPATNEEIAKARRTGNPVIWRGKRTDLTAEYENYKCGGK